MRYSLYIAGFFVLQEECDVANPIFLALLQEGLENEDLAPARLFELVEN